ncbi:uncharacterized protein BXIN_0080 [Babesia sp. Xinjiang]|uniref:uncharacterized protein n=1 Tax=Babesia sp. Xinjiang TaxID=462227 RepID=UPI000A2193F3|nr:uncharacterized protein BXIN_0080 [Babesia sp. Xinjiang]ORM39624.1 hypothetical protein BXIN_0080 [Babesia sp. Xinjiang]
MASLRVTNYVANWRTTAPSADTDEPNSDEELDSFLKECQSRMATGGHMPMPKKRYEYVISGIFRDTNVQFDPAKVLPSESSPDNNSHRLSDPMYQSELYRDFLNTLSHLMETHRVEAYERLTFTRRPLAQSRNPVNFTSKTATEESKTVELHIHKPPSKIAGRCTLVHMDHLKASMSSADVVVREVGSGVSADMATVLPLCDFIMTKRMFVCGHIFTSNYGNPSHVEIAVLRHYLDCNPQAPASPNGLLVEIRCRGEADIETYKTRLREYARLLYNYVEFSFE